MDTDTRRDPLNEADVARLGGARKSVERGIAQSKVGDTHDLGSFADAVPSPAEDALEHLFSKALVGSYGTAAQLDANEEYQTVFSSLLAPAEAREILAHVTDDGLSCDPLDKLRRIAGDS
jgi:hypothetical protein